MDPLEKMFAPRSIAVIGASRREGSLGKMFLDSVVGLQYTGKIFPVNPKADQINNIPCFPDIFSLPEVPELAVILLHKEFVLQSVQELAQKGVRSVIVISAGFKEVGGEGIELEKQLLQLIRANHMRMIGPNCMGLFNTRPEVSLNATFSPTQPLPGQVGFISQSGALGVAVLELSKSIQLGFSIFVSTGNKADVGDADVIKYLGHDDNTKVITLYQESIDQPSDFREACLRIVPDKPVLSLKAGRTASGYRAASSHTGALASDDVITDAFLKQCGIIRCESLQELLYSALAFSRQPLPAGNRIAVITNSGGPAILASDALEKFGLQLAPLKKETIDQLQHILPAEASCINPIDMIASAIHDTYQKVYALVEQDFNVDAIIVIIVKPPVGTSPERIIEELAPIIRSSVKPFFLVLMASTDGQSGPDLYRKYAIPVFSFPETAAQVLGKMWEYKQIKEKIGSLPPGFEHPDKKILNLSKKTCQASFEEIAKRLNRYQLPLVPYLITTSLADCISFHENHGPIGLKIANPEIIHKSDAGLVLLDLTTPADIQSAYGRIMTRASSLLPAGTNPVILVQKMVSSGVELVLGYKYDPSYGDAIMFGIGGVFVELYKDVVFRVLPLSLQEAGEMVLEIRGSKLLTGYRNKPALNLDDLARIIFDFSRLVAENPDILEMDLNPLIWPYDLSQPVIVDCRMTVQI